MAVNHPRTIFAPRVAHKFCKRLLAFVEILCMLMEVIRAAKGPLLLSLTQAFPNSMITLEVIIIRVPKLTKSANG